MSIQTVTALIPHQALLHGRTLPTIVNFFSPMRRVQTQSTLFLIGACWRDSGIRFGDTLGSQNFKHHPAIPDRLGWFVRHLRFDLKAAAANALKLNEKVTDEINENSSGSFSGFPSLSACDRALRMVPDRQRSGYFPIIN